MARKRKLSDSEVLVLYRDGFSASRIAALKGVSRQYVSRVLRSLRVSDPASFVLGDDKALGSPKNVHAQRVRAFVHWSGDSYKRSPNLVLKDFVGGVDVSCAGRFIYLKARKKFGGESESKALWNSLGFWERVLSRLESRLGVVIFKKGSVAFEFLYQEFETRDSVVALDSEQRGHLWKVYHNEDGRLRLSVDWSDREPNHETHHFRDAHSDSVTFERFTNDLLNNPQAPTFSQIASIVKDIAEQHKTTAEGLNAVTEVIKTQFPQKRDEVLEPLEKGGVWYVG